ncbi:hypothetical protein [Streptomyces adelaidensis]|uniref:hypothetical protein n=1 Tax=Streptomyces adelaidensis TaxID=2796465 RepID=UPI001F2128D7|nr:hypothetical protein [Streptomyces adelaidensis]
MNPGPRRLLRSTLRTRRRRFVRLAGWSLVQAVPALLSGWLVARAVDEGFLADRNVEGLGWLALLACAVLIGAWGTRQATFQWPRSSSRSATPWSPSSPPARSTAPPVSGSPPTRPAWPG